MQTRRYYINANATAIETFEAACRRLVLNILPGRPPCNVYGTPRVELSVERVSRANDEYLMGVRDTVNILAR